jgi:hypothetical protein
MPDQIQPCAVGTHIYFLNLGRKDGRKTSIFEVYSNYDDHLGTIKWFTNWRKYVFSPNANTLYEETCMREISQFIEDQTTLQREMAAAKRKAAKA